MPYQQPRRRASCQPWLLHPHTGKFNHTLDSLFPSGWPARAHQCRNTAVKYTWSSIRPPRRQSVPNFPSQGVLRTHSEACALSWSTHGPADLLPAAPRPRTHRLAGVRAVSPRRHLRTPRDIFECMGVRRTVGRTDVCRACSRNRARPRAWRRKHDRHG